jgi:hypothetical protein
MTPSHKQNPCADKRYLAKYVGACVSFLLVQKASIHWRGAHAQLFSLDVAQGTNNRDALNA